MAFLIGGANSEADTGYKVANSCRFNDDDDAYMHITPGSAGNKRIWTFSTWLKRSLIATTITGGDMRIFSTDGSAGGPYGALQFGADDRFICWSYNGTDFDQYHRTNRVFRDPSAWYHIVVAVDTTQGVAANRTKIYFNGVQETSWLTETIHDQNDDSEFNHDTKWWLASDDNQDYVFDGYLAETVFIDGTQYAASDFGEFDEDSPTIWKPKDVSGLTFGTNGFYLDFEDSSNLGNDANGGTDLTEVNLAATDSSTDSPTNNFATLNSINGLHYAGLTFSEGNLKVTTTASQYAPAQSTIGFNSGKWYAEFKATDVDNWTMVGIVGQNATATSSDIGKFSDGYGYIGGSGAGSGNSKRNNDTTTSYAATYADGDIISVAVDCDNNNIYFGLNGTWLDSGDPESGATGTGAAYSISATPSSGFYFFACGNYSGSQTPDWEANFGNPPYANSSSVADANGYGAFEYAVPSGYYALCTKNLAKYGG